MTLEHNLILKHITDLLETAITSAFPDTTLDRTAIYAGISETPNIKMGHFAFPCFPLAKALKKAPVQIATIIKENMPESDSITEVLLQGPYVNFKLSPKGFGKNLISDVLSGKFFDRELTSHKPKTMIEYSQPNTHKEMHVGHMRNLCLGNALVNIKKYCKQDVVPVTYPGDSGTHVAKCLWYLKFHNKDKMPTEAKGEWLGRIYSTANLKLEDELGTDNEDTNRAQLTEILRQLHSEEGEFFELWKETRQWSLDLMQKTYDWADVKFDRWFFESEMDQPSIDICNKYYEKGLFVKDDGAIGMDLKEDKLGFCILIKSDGTGLYATKDVALAIQKFEEFGVENNIYIVDSRQAFHFKQVFKVLDKIGFEQAKDCFHLPYEMVELPGGAMSSRKGNVVALSELVNSMESTIVENYLEKYRGDWSDDEIKSTAHMIANGAIKYGMVRMDNNRKIVFDMKEWLKLDGETGPYLQYVYARINSLLNKQGYNADSTVDYTNLSSDTELALMLKMSFFNDIALKAHEQNKTNIITSYLFELGKLFNSFYAECPIGKAENDVKEARLALAKSCSQIISKGLELIGVQVPSRM
ncbi:MAG: arginine--tRNA ligase [Bacteriovorax sp. MedPE-SWde]|nr:MAG: arginine--tRNA ligase [Bacteriovorax sp. MedPE-SWde]